MAGDSFSEVTHQSWFGRIGNSIKNVLLGVVLFGVAFPVLWWNEGRSVKRYRTLKEGAGQVIAVQPDAVDNANEGKLVHVSAKAVTEDTLTDDTFGLSLSALRLKRNVEMYQWKESTSRRKKKKLGGGTTTVTTYNYSKVWSSNLLESSQFRKPEGHANPTSMPFPSQSYQADTVTAGAFELADSLVSKISNFSPVQAAQKASLPAALRDRVKPHGDSFYVGSNPQAPAIGDARISFSAALPADVSIVARQTGSTLGPFQTKAGGSLELLQMGTVAADVMFEKAQQQNRVITWLIRLGGFLLMAIGLGLVFKPLSVLADVLPFLGTLVGMGTGLVAFLLALCFSLITIAIAWLAYRPLLGIGLLVGAVIVAGLILGRGKSVRRNA